jgi:hypothetical protein
MHVSATSWIAAILVLTHHVPGRCALPLVPRSGGYAIPSERCSLSPSLSHSPILRPPGVLTLFHSQLKFRWWSKVLHLLVAVILFVRRICPSDRAVRVHVSMWGDNKAGW